MRYITKATLVGAALAVASLPLIAADTVRSEPQSVRAVSASGGSDADVLAERHLALYRASQLPTVTSEAASENDADTAQTVARSSATAALPLPPRVASPHVPAGR